MKEFDSKKLLQNIGILLVMEICMVIPLLVYWFGPYNDGFGLVFTIVLTALIVPFLFGLTNVKMISKLLISFIAATLYDVIFVLCVNTDLETLIVYFWVLCVVSLVGVSLGSLINLIVKAIIKKIKKSDSIPEKKEG